jgi:hypothetical protein
MPSILTHQYFANLILEEVKKTIPFLTNQQSLLWLGSQGPDPFFFYGHAILRKRLSTTSINQFGSTLHNQEPMDSLWPLIEHGWFGSKADEVTKAYVIGALTHYALDRTCHPYVFYRTGFDEHGSLTGHYSADHARLEVEMDVALVDKFNLKSKVYQPKETLNLSKVSLQSISQLYFQAFPKQVQHDTFQLAVEDMQSTYRFLYHGSMLNRLLVVLVSGRRSLPMSLIHPRFLSVSVKDRSLNLSRKLWKDPVTGKTSQATMMQLINDAKTYLLPILKLLIQGKLTKAFVKEWTDRIDYDGKPIGKTMKYFSSYYASYKGKPNHDNIRVQPSKKSV